MTWRFALAPTLALIAIAFARVAGAAAPELSGLWDGIVRFNDVDVAFPLEFKREHGQLRASLFNGAERINSTSATLTGETLVVNFDHYATQLRGTIRDGVLTGTYGNDALMGQHAVELRPHRKPALVSGKAPNIAGLWILPYESTKGERAFRLMVRQRGPEVSAAILRIDGDTGLLTGRYDGSKFVLSVFDGGRANVLEIVPRTDGRLDLALLGDKKSKSFVATRVEQAESLPQPTVFTTHTTMKDPQEPLNFSFPDFSGNLVARSDPRFAGKVLIVNITGSWCPNCHDEAPLLAELYRRYRPLGLEIVAIDFEETGQQRNLPRLQAFIRNFNLGYTYLLAGTTDDVANQLPQVRNLNAWPTTFFVGRDGRVQSIHAGFAAPASGEFHAQTKREFIATVERLLAQ